MYVPNFMIVEFVSLIMSQFTKNAQNILYLNQCTRVTSEYGRSHSIKCSGADINALTGIKIALDKCLFVLYWR